MRFILIILSVVLFIPSVGFSQTKQVIVTSAPVTEGFTGNTVNITGSIYFSVYSSVAAESSGKVGKVYINEGDTVKAGDPLASLDDKLLTYSIEVATADTAQTRALVDKTKRDYERNKSLYEQEAVAQRTYDDSLTDYKNAENAYSAAVANERKLKTEKEKMVIRAPFDGVVTSKDVNVGEWVNAGGVVAGIAALDFEAKVFLPEKILKYVKVGDKVPVSTDSGEFQGVILSVNSKGDPATRTFQSRIKLGLHPELKEGALATAKMPAGQVIKSLLVPRDAAVTVNSVRGVYLISGDKAVFTPITVLANSGGNLAIKSDGKLKAGDLLVINGNETVTNGATVKIVPGFSK